MTKKIHACLVRLVVVGGASLSSLACVDSSPVREPTGTGPFDTPGNASGGLDGSLGDGGPQDCFDDPKTHFEIINACTNATRIEKNPTLKKLLSDGGLPPLE